MNLLGDVTGAIFPALASEAATLGKARLKCTEPA
jgi:hypothetical protein